MSMSVGEAVVVLVNEAKFAKRLSKTGLERIRRAARACRLTETELLLVLFACEYAPHEFPGMGKEPK